MGKESVYMCEERGDESRDHRHIPQMERPKEKRFRLRIVVVLGKGIRFCFGVVTSVCIVDEAQSISRQAI